MEGLSALPDPGTAGIGSLEFGGLQNQGWRGSGSNLREPWDALMQAAFGDSVVARQMKALAALRAGDAQTAHEQTMPIAMDLASFVGNIKPVGGPIRAYHGSPHDFDKFSMDKIGSGEGAQAYGHGLYFAENEGVARSYRANLARPNFSTGIDDLNRMLDEAYQQLSRQATGPINISDAADLVGERLARQRADALRASDFKWFERVSDNQIALQRLREAPPKIPGSMYEVNIHADPERFLDWDKPLSGQNESALAAIKETGLNIEKMNGREGLKSIPLPQFGKVMPPPPPLPAPEGGRPLGQIYSAIERTMGADRATAAFRDAGIPGIKYLDAGSRGAGDGTRNYVVFDDKLIEILRKYGIGGILAGGAGAAGIGSLDESGL